jgi:hypothetical protein
VPIEFEFTGSTLPLSHGIGGRGVNSCVNTEGKPPAGVSEPSAVEAEFADGTLAAYRRCKPAKP